MSNMLWGGGGLGLVGGDCETRPSGPRFVKKQARYCYVDYEPVRRDRG